jgi:transposase
MPRPKRPAGPPRPRRVYTAEFKAEAVQLLRTRQAAGATLAAVSRELDVSADQLRDWERRAVQHGAVPRAGESEAEELRRLRREVETLRQEREFLKKATAFFAKESR